MIFILHKYTLFTHVRVAPWHREQYRNIEINIPLYRTYEFNPISAFFPYIDWLKVTQAITVSKHALSKRVYRYTIDTDNACISTYKLLAHILVFDEVDEHPVNLTLELEIEIAEE